MEKIHSPDSNAGEKSNFKHIEAGRSSRRPWFFAAGGLLVILIAIVMPRPGNEVPTQADSTDAAALQTASNSPAARRVRQWHRSPNPDPAPTRTAEEIVASKVSQFARNRRALAHAMADHFKIEVPVDAERFFAAVEAGRWEEIDAAFKPVAARYNAKPRPHDLDALWGPILESLGVAESAHDWPVQKLLDYGSAVLGALRPGMVYVGGTDPGRFIPTLLNETSDGERHVIVTQNGLAAGSYVDYLSFLYSDRLATLTHEDSNRAFQDYFSDFQRRLAHDQQFPDELKQVLPDENKSDGIVSFPIASQDGRVEVSGQAAVMAVNERLLQMLLQKNPDLSFALEESFPLKSTYLSATPLGPIMELRIQDEQNALTRERAAQSVDYWRATAQQLLSDPEAAGSLETRAAYAKMAMSQANLFADHNFAAEAEQAYHLASEIRPDSTEAVRGLSELLARTGRVAEACKLLDDFIQSHPDKRAAVDASRRALFPAVSPATALRP